MNNVIINNASQWLRDREQAKFNKKANRLAFLVILPAITAFFLAHLVFFISNL